MTMQMSQWRDVVSTRSRQYVVNILHLWMTLMLVKSGKVGKSAGLLACAKTSMLQS